VVRAHPLPDMRFAVPRGARARRVLRVVPVGGSMNRSTQLALQRAYLEYAIGQLHLARVALDHHPSRYQLKAAGAFLAADRLRQARLEAHRA
jgi:hypothetical protein